VRGGVPLRVGLYSLRSPSRPKRRLGPAGDDPSRIPSGLKPLRSDRKLRSVALGLAATRLLRARPRPLRGGALRAKRNLPALPAPYGGSLQPVFLEQVSTALPCPDC
jgi:hypothetical protein